MNVHLSGVCRYRVILLLLSLIMTPSLNALEYDITGIGLRENRFSRGGDSHLGGIPLDYNGVVSAFPGLSGKISLYEKNSGWGGMNLFWQLGGMLHTWNLIDLYFGPVFRLSFYLSKRWSVDCDVSLVWNIWYNYHTIRLRFLLTPFIALFPSLRYRGNEYTAGFNLAYVPECIGFPFTDNDMAYFFTSFKLNSEKDKDELMRGGSQFSVATIAFGEVDHNRLKDLLASSNVSRLNLKGSQSRLDSALESSEDFAGKL